MSRNQLRMSQLVTTFGPGAMVDLPDASVVVAGTNEWNYDRNMPGLISEPRLVRKVRGLLRNPQLDLRMPPGAGDGYGFRPTVTAFRFPEWHVVQLRRESEDERWSRQLLVHQDLVRNGKYEHPTQGKLEAVPVRFVRACNRGHLDDFDWHFFVKHKKEGCRGQLVIEDRGTSSNLEEYWVSCEACKARRPMSDATLEGSLGPCSGRRPWLGPYTREGCDQKSRLLIRTATNAYFPQVMRVISIPETQSEVDMVVQGLWEDFLSDVEDEADLTRMRGKPSVRSKLSDFSDAEVMGAIERVRAGSGGDRPVKDAEMDALSRADEEMGADVPDGDFYARSLAASAWAGDLMARVERVVLVHRLREVAALVGFTRFEAVTEDITGELDMDVERAPVGLDVDFVPAIENRGEGIFLKFRKSAIDEWLARPAVEARRVQLEQGFVEWKRRKEIGVEARWPGLAYLMLHSLSHMLMTAIVLECGYPSSAVRERVYANEGQFGILIYTSSSDAEGTLGGLIQAGRDIRRHLAVALESGALCSNDPICAQHVPSENDAEPLLGSACHGCLLVPETSCEMFNEHLDRALVVRTLENLGAEFFVGV